MSYRPDPAASRLAAGRTGTVIVAVPIINSWYFSTVMAGAEAVCADAGLEFQVIGLSNDEARNRLLDEDRQIERRADGLILVDVRITPEQVASLERRNVGLATVGRSVHGHPAVCIDDEHVGRIAAEHLLGLGHERLAIIGGLADDPMNFDVPKSRRRGFEQELDARGISLDPGLVANGNFSVADGVEAMNDLLAHPHSPTAVFAMSDEMAFGAVTAMKSAGLNPGIDVSIIGVDDHEFSSVIDLTTIRQPVVDHGARAARLLLASMEAEPNAGSATNASFVHRPELELIVRATTGPPNAT